MAKRKDWRDDPGWKLTFFDSGRFKRAPSNRPPAKAELAQPPNWASLYDGTVMIATWFRDAVRE